MTCRAVLQGTALSQANLKQSESVGRPKHANEKESEITFRIFRTKNPFWVYLQWILFSAHLQTFFRGRRQTPSRPQCFQDRRPSHGRLTELHWPAFFPYTVLWFGSNRTLMQKPTRNILPTSACSVLKTCPKISCTYTRTPTTFVCANQSKSSRASSANDRQKFGTFAGTIRVSCLDRGFWKRVTDFSFYKKFESIFFNFENSTDPSSLATTLYRTLISTLFQNIVSITDATKPSTRRTVWNLCAVQWESSKCSRQLHSTSFR